MNAATFSALAEPNRLHIIEILRNGSFSVNEIADKLKLRQPQTTKHLQVLARAGIVTATPVAQKRVYELRAEPFIEIDQWIKSYEQLWGHRLDAMEAYARKVETESRLDRASDKNRTSN